MRCGGRCVARLETGPEGAQHAARARRRGPVAVARQRLADRADDQPAHQARIAEAHIRFRRMHVDIDQSRIERQRQHGHRIASGRDRLGIGAADRRQDQLVLHRAAVDEGILMRRVAAVEGRHAGKAGERDALALGVELDRIVAEFLAEHLRHAGEMVVAGRRKFERRAVGAGQHEAHARERRSPCA